VKPGTAGSAPLTRDVYAQAEIRTAARYLLRTPLLQADAHPDELALVRRYRSELMQLFSKDLGYRLVVEPGLARLFKAGPGAHSGRGLRRRNGVDFDPRRYAFVALALAALTRARRQLMVDELVSGIRSAAVDAGIDIDLDAIAQRRALHSALVALIDIGVLSERDGDLEHWAEQRTQSLLDVHRDRLAVLIAAPLSGCSGPGDVMRVAAVPSSVGGARVAIRRLLVEQPVMSVADLTEEQHEWWKRNRHRERDWFRRCLGLELELRAEGAVAVDPKSELTDLEFPAGGSVRHYALLLLDALVSELRAGQGPTLAGTTWARIVESTARTAGDRVFDRWSRGLRKAHRENPDLAYQEAIAVLVEIGLVRRVDGALLVHAAAARYAPRPELVSNSQSGERSLFDPEDS